MRGATISLYHRIDSTGISTHAPHARCDELSVPKSYELYDFYSRTSCEVRPRTQDNLYHGFHFYSRTSCEVRPLRSGYQFRQKRFLLTHLMRGATRISFSVLSSNPNFYSRTSCEVRLDVGVESYVSMDDFYSRTSCEVRLLSVYFINHT